MTGVTTQGLDEPSTSTVSRPRIVRDGESGWWTVEVDVPGTVKPERYFGETIERALESAVNGLCQHIHAVHVAKR